MIADLDVQGVLSPGDHVGVNGSPAEDARRNRTVGAVVARLSARYTVGAAAKLVTPKRSSTAYVVSTLKPASSRRFRPPMASGPSTP